MDGSDINHSYIWTLAIYHAVLHPFFPFFNNLGGHVFRLYQKMMKIRISGFSGGGEPPLIHIWIHFGCAKPLSFRGCFCNNLEHSITIIYLIQFLFHFPISPENISQMGKPGLSYACGLAKLTQLVNKWGSQPLVFSTPELLCFWGSQCTLSALCHVGKGKEYFSLYPTRMSAWGPANSTDKRQTNKRKNKHRSWWVAQRGG